MTKTYCDLCGKEMKWPCDKNMYKYKLRKAILWEGWKYIDAHPGCVNELCDTVEKRRTVDERL